MKTERITKSCSSVAGFISEAANLVLLRVMAWRQTVPSNARFLALDTEGKLCLSTYVRSPLGKGREGQEVGLVEEVEGLIPVFL